MQNGSPIIRTMQPGEETALVRAARRAFVHSPVEQLAISKPKLAMVAQVDGKLAGAMFVQVAGTGEYKSGYLSLGFVIKEFRGHGVGRVLYPAAIEYLREMGCKTITAMVIDDNAASWKSLENKGFGAPSMLELVGALGIKQAFLLWLRSLFCISCGARLWMDKPVKKRGTVHELWTFLWVNLILFSPRFLAMAGEPAQLVLNLAAFPSTLLAVVLLGRVGCLIAGNTWHFSFPRGGALLTLFQNFVGGLFPMAGRWYLNSPDATKESRRAMGLQAAIEWIGVLVIYTLGAFLLPEVAFLHRCGTIAATLLFYRLIPFFPLSAFGGRRVFDWSKGMFVLLGGISLIMLSLVWFG